MRGSQKIPQSPWVVPHPLGSQHPEEWQQSGHPCPQGPCVPRPLEELQQS